MNKKVIVAISLISVLAISCTNTITGQVRNKDGKEYVMPYSRDTASYVRINDKGEVYREKFINERDRSNNIIVYSELDDAPARHCLGKDGHPILKENKITGEMERICRLDTPGARVEGSEIEVDEIDYYIANTENKYLWEKTYEEKRNSEEGKVYSDERYTHYAKYTRPDKKEEIRARYLEPKAEMQQILRNLYKKKLKEQYGIEE